MSRRPTSTKRPMLGDPLLARPSAESVLPERATAFTHFGLSGLAMSDSLSWRDGGSGDGAFAGAVWRPPPGKRGAFLHARLVETGGPGVRVRPPAAARGGGVRRGRLLLEP